MQRFCDKIRVKKLIRLCAEKSDKGALTMSFVEFINGFSLPAAICLAVGLILMLVEMFTPGFGAAGIVGLLSLLAAIVLSGTTFAEKLWMTVIILAILGLMLLIFLHSATKGKLSKSQIILNDSIDANARYISSEDLEYFVGREGKALTILRPSGIADFDGVRLDVVTEGDFIPAGSRVRVNRIDRLNLVVEKLAAPAPEGGGEQ